MVKVSDLILLVSNIISEDNYKHCRLCLKSIVGNFMKFEDTVSLNSEENIFTISELMRNFLGEEVEKLLFLVSVIFKCIITNYIHF